MANVNDLILKELQYLRGKLDTVVTDVAVIKDNHNTGNRSEKIAAWSAVTAVLVSVIALATACGVITGNKPYERTYKSSPVVTPTSSHFVPGKLRPKKQPVPSRRDEYSESPSH